jgi:hypothetical protein
MLLGVVHEGRDGVVSMATSAEIGQSTVSVDFHGDHSTPAVLSHLKHFKKWVIKVYKSSSIKMNDIPGHSTNRWAELIVCMGIWSIWRSLDPFHQMSTGQGCHLRTNLFEIFN